MKLLVPIVLASMTGGASGLIVSTPLIWFANLRAADGPYFPPPLVALLLMVLPMALVLLPVLMISLLLRQRRSRWGFGGDVLVGATAGISSAALLNLLVFSSSASCTAAVLLPWIAVGVVQGVVSLSSLRLATLQRE